MLLVEPFIIRYLEFCFYPDLHILPNLSPLIVTELGL